MNYIKKLPFVISLLITILVGIICYTKDVDVKDIYLRMAVCLGIFILPGILYKKTLFQLEDELNTKTEKDAAIKSKNRTAAQKTESTLKSSTSEIDISKENIKKDFDADGNTDEKLDLSSVESEEELDLQDEFSPWDLNDIINYKVQKK